MFVVIQDWMCSELNLKGNDLLIYALIYGFSQDGESRFSGSRKYIAETFNISLPTVDKSLKNLIDRNLVERHKEERAGITFYSYNSFLPVKKLSSPGKETLPNNIDNNIDITNSKELVQNTTNQNSPTFNFGNYSKQKPKENLYYKCIHLVDDLFKEPTINSLLKQYLLIRLEIKDKPLYGNQWKGMLKKLQAMKNQKEVVQQSIDKCYLSFYPVTNTYGTDRFSEGSGVSAEPYTKEELERLNEIDRQLETQGYQTRY